MVAKRTIARIKTEAQARAAFALLSQDLEKFIKSIKGTTFDAVKEMTQVVLDDSQERVPVRFGDLKRSGFRSTFSDGKKIIGVVGYAKGDDPPYAVFVHEDLEAKHPNGENKFLEKAVKGNMSNLRAIALKHARGALK